MHENTKLQGKKAFKIKNFVFIQKIKSGSARSLIFHLLYPYQRHGGLLPGDIGSVWRGTGSFYGSERCCAVLPSFMALYNNYSLTWPLRKGGGGGGMKMASVHPPLPSSVIKLQCFPFILLQPESISPSPKWHPIPFIGHYFRPGPLLSANTSLGRKTRGGGVSTAEHFSVYKCMSPFSLSLSTTTSIFTYFHVWNNWNIYNSLYCIFPPSHALVDKLAEQRGVSVTVQNGTLFPT